MNFATNFLKKFSPKSKQIKFRRINGNSSRVIVQNGPKKTTILMRGLVAFFLISTTASIYNRDKIVNQFGLDSGTKYTITVIDLDKKNLKNRNYFQTQTSFLSKEDISSQATFYMKLTPFERGLTVRYFNNIYTKLNEFPPHLNYGETAMQFYLANKSYDVSDSFIKKALSESTSFSTDQATLQEVKNRFDHEFDSIIEGLYFLLEKKYSKNFCKEVIRDICVANNFTQMPHYFFSPAPRVFSIRFEGDSSCNQLQALREQVDFLLENANKNDCIIIHLDSPGGTVTSYGQAAFQLKRLREAGLQLEVSVDQVAASGGYLMACVANKIYASSFSIIGSIGVYMSSINFSERLNKEGIYEKNFVAGENKKNYSPFDTVTPENEKKLIQDVESIHTIFKNFVASYRPLIDLKKTADGSVFLGEEALTLGLVDEIKTYEEILNSYSIKGYRLYSLKTTEKKTFRDSPFFGDFNNLFNTMQSKYTNIMALSPDSVSPLELFKLLFLR